ncbi:MAG: ATP-binding cassette domain-containing protein [Alphaproteobacteria bacterium]|nr:ATP-binding cassette domain-containing protein [Alphaproteobacteria bacterium]
MTTRPSGPDTGAHVVAGEGEVFLSLSQITKRFGRFTALAGVDLEVPRGALVAILGPSGCGKSTLLRVVAGLESQDGGRVLQAGRDISRLPPEARDFGIVFQSYALFPNLSIGDNVGYGLANRGIALPERRRRVADLLALVGLQGAEAKYPAQMSGGQQQRVALARALALEPGLLLLDEPLSALDAQVRLHLRQEIRALQRRLGITTILVTHDQEEAMTMGDLVVVMNKGVVEQSGAPDTLYNHPSTAFIAEFIGTSTAIRGVVRDGVFKAGPISLPTERGIEPALANGRWLARVRPEHCVLADSGYAGQVVSREFLGPVVRFAIDIGLPDQAPILVDHPAGDPRQVPLVIGANVAVEIPAQSLRFFAGA